MDETALASCWFPPALEPGAPRDPHDAVSATLAPDGVTLGFRFVGSAPSVVVFYEPRVFETPTAVCGREGARALAVWLNEAGHRTKAGRPWSHTAVLTVLRNPVYVGKVFFRDALHDGPHEHLVEGKLFDQVQALLSERGEDWSKRASATSPYLLAGLVVCDRCGKHFVGTSAVGNRYRYRYYTCFTRQRYGRAYCDAERLPAEDLDAAVLDALFHTYEHTDLFDKAVTAARHRARAERANHEQELAVVDAGITKAEEAIERYLSAFEAGTLTEAQCGKRLEGLAAKGRDLRARREELVAAMEYASANAPDPGEIAPMRHHIAHALAYGAVPARKALLQALVHEIRVESRDRVVPWFRVPGGANPKVRALARSAPPAGAGPLLRRVVRLSRKLALG